MDNSIDMKCFVIDQKNSLPLKIVCDGATVESIIRVVSQVSCEIQLQVSGPSQKVTVIIDMKFSDVICNIKCLVKTFGRQKCTLRVYQNHYVPRSESFVAIKGVVHDASSIDYEGLISMEESTAAAKAFQRSDFLVLSDAGFVRSLPGLRVLQNDLECGHATTIKYCDEMILFYCNQRGIDQKHAQRLLEAAFIENFCQ